MFCNKQHLNYTGQEQKNNLPPQKKKCQFTSDIAVALKQGQGHASVDPKKAYHHAKLERLSPLNTCKC